MCFKFRKPAQGVGLALVLAIGLVPNFASAASHTWIPLRQALSANPTLPRVTIDGNSIGWGDGSFDNNDFSIEPPQSGGSGIGVAIANAKDRALDLANLCRNPYLPDNVKNTPGTDDVTNRWLAATGAFITIEQQNLWSMYGAAAKMTIIVDGKTFAGFKVTYSDNSTEVWVVTPNHFTSEVKLFEQPAPGTLTVGNGQPACTKKG